MGLTILLGMNSIVHMLFQLATKLPMDSMKLDKSPLAKHRLTSSGGS